MRKRDCGRSALELAAHRPHSANDCEHQAADEERGKSCVTRHARGLAELVVVERRGEYGERKRRRQHEKRQRLRENLESRRPCYGDEAPH